MISSKRHLSNILSVLVNCSHDNSFLLILNDERGDYWIPSTTMDERYSWKDNLLMFKKRLFDYEIINEKLLKVVKIWTLEKEYFHLIFQVNLPKEFKTNCKTDTSLVRLLLAVLKTREEVVVPRTFIFQLLLFQGKVGWYSCAQVAKLKPQLRSLEILEIIQKYYPRSNSAENSIGEILPMGPLTEVRESDVLVSSENNENTVYLNLLDSAGLPAPEQYSLYEEFFMCTYPCIYMNRVAFNKAIGQFQFTGNLDNLFRAADAWKRDFLTFHDFLYLIAVMEPFTTHYGHLGEVRCQYIFRYYDDNGDGKLNYHNFQNLMSDIYSKLDCKTELNNDKQIEAVAKSINFKTNSFMTFEEFYSHVLDAKIKDTTLLLRFENSHSDIKTFDGGEDQRRSLIPDRFILSAMSRSVDQQKKDTGDDYKIVLKTTILKPGDPPLEIKDFRLLEETMTKSVSEDFKVLSNLKFMPADSFDLEGKINELLLALQYFCTEICQSPLCCGEVEMEEKEAYSWGSAYIEKLGIILIMMCESLKEILKAEPRLLQLEPPVFIMGDLHGNIHDLMCFEKTLWGNGIALLPARLLFLGDYVDRGLNSIEVLMYLFANKIQNPEKLFLIRGNHEIREIQKLFTFQRECIFKFGDTLGMSIWKAVNDVFDVMPLAAIIDHKVFCCHGGIPPPWLCPIVAVINSIPCPLVNCERQSPLAWTLMWNDPLKSIVPRNSIQEIELLTNEGFIPNAQRGTGYAFSCDALDKFLLSNNLTHVVRAHEVVKAGFQVHQKGKLLTVFSSSGYCGGKNFAGSVLVADKLLRVFMVHTGIN